MIFLQVFTLFFVGVVIGNFVTTFYFRIPRGLPVNGLELPPVCDSCGVRIPHPYYFPVFGLVLNGGKCPNCGFVIPKIYLFIELLCGVTCVAFFALHGLNEASALRFFLFFAVLIGGMLYLQYGKFYEKANWIIAVLALGTAAALGRLPFYEFVCGIAAALLFFSVSLARGEKREIEDMFFLVALSLGLPISVFLACTFLFILLFQFGATRRFCALIFALGVFFCGFS